MSAPITPEENSIMFTSTRFTYTANPTKKGGYSITIVPANVKYVAKLIMEIYDNGTATLMVTSNYRDVISFDGKLSPLTP